LSFRKGEKMSRPIRVFGFVILSLALCVPGALAQQKQKDPRVNPPIQPIPPLPAGESSSTRPSETPAPPPTNSAEDRQTFSGVEEYSVGLASGGYSVLEGRFHVSQFLDTNTMSNTNDRIGTASLVSVQLGLRKSWRNSQLGFQYSSGGLVYGTQGRSSSFPQQFGVSHSIQLRRWSLSFTNQFAYLPESSAGGFGGAGFGGFGGGGLPGGTLGSGIPGLGGQLNPAFVPNQGVYSGASSRISNAIGAQANYLISGRSSITVGGSFGVLHFLDSSLIDSRQLSVRTGYNFKINGTDTVAVSYGYGRFGFNGGISNVENHSVQLLYGRRLSGRLAWHVGAGPQFNRNQNQTNGTLKQVSFSASTGLNFTGTNGSSSLTYFRAMTGGSGVFAGAQSDSIQFSTGRKVSRLWAASLGLRYSHNKALGNGGGITTANSFHSWAANAGMSRPLGRYSNMSFNYGMQWQNNSVGTCGGAACPSSFLRHVFGIQFDFSFRPIRLE
jgi:hypothetical protein